MLVTLLKTGLCVLCRIHTQSGIWCKFWYLMYCSFQLKQNKNAVSSTPYYMKTYFKDRVSRKAFSRLQNGSVKVLHNYLSPSYGCCSPCPFGLALCFHPYPHYLALQLASKDIENLKFWKLHKLCKISP